MSRMIAALALSFSLLLAASVLAAEKGFSWSAAPDPTWGTKIYIGTAPGVYPNSEDAGVGTTTYSVANLLPGTTYYITATHYNSKGYESEYAKEVVLTTEALPTLTFNPLPPVLGTGIKSYSFTLTVQD